MSKKKLPELPKFTLAHSVSYEWRSKFTGNLYHFIKGEETEVPEDDAQVLRQKPDMFVECFVRGKSKSEKIKGKSRSFSTLKNNGEEKPDSSKNVGSVQTKKTLGVKAKSSKKTLKKRTK